MIERGDKGVELPQSWKMAFFCAYRFSFIFHPAAVGLSNLTDPDCREAGWAQEFIRPLVFQRHLEELVEPSSDAVG